MTQNSLLPETGYLRLPEVLRLISVSKATWWNGVKSGRFPKSVKLAPRITAWRVTDIKHYINNLSDRR